MIDLRRSAAVCGAVLALTLGASGSAFAAASQGQAAAGAASQSTTTSTMSPAAAKQVTATNKVLDVALSGGSAAQTSFSATQATSPQIVKITDQCGKSLPQRTGAWVCSGTGDSAIRGTSSANDSSGLTASAAQAGGYCLSFAPECWKVNNDFSAEFDGTNTYGYGDKVLGNYEMGTTWGITGYVTKSQPFWAKFSAPVEDLIMVSDRLYYDSNHRSGERLNPPKTDPRVMGYAVGYVSTGKPGSILRDGSVNLGGVMQTMSWHVDGYPGLWVTYVKSPQFIKDGTVYRFMSARNLPEDAWNAYWNPAG